MKSTRKTGTWYVLSRYRSNGSWKIHPEHDKKIANKLAYVMAGGDLSEPTLVSEQYLLD
jgi:hypothetical protein